ncbi:Prolipoprotein LppL [Corynebacterium pseudotuberculosis]|nr:Prolipoprotein LppL [Corynebacterium pseudotuberculosis 1/06-A]APQ56237.1 Prolipoprotein LppL [Corynebacterium pseudotuberculosis]ATB62003.1 Prolipoprotein LppL [Corynebacterium pseudotuberculosis]ATV80674.1 Prolipoprotein LppL [Corynebacterium pseudotuberculosis]AUY60508.1 Prolipoprotein LppL [Corynebacterium pseudotuberculosis]
MRNAQSMSGVRRAAIAGLVVLSLSLAACTKENGPDPQENAGVQGNATPQKSPASSSPSGQVLPFAAILGMQKAGNILAVREKTVLHLGSIKNFYDGTQKRIDVQDSCGALTATDREFILPCPDGVHVVDALTPDKHDVVTGDPATAAVKTTSGEIIAGDSATASLRVYRNGEDPQSIKTEFITNQIVAIPVDGQPDAVARVNNEHTVIQDIHWAEGKSGALLRVGRGVGQISPAEQSILLASDTVVGQLMVYGAEDVIRLHQSSPVGASPWAVAWDKKNQQAWVSTTSDNKLTAYSLSSGTAEPKRHYSSVADVHSVVVLDDATVIAGSATGDGLQIIAP